MNFSRFIKYSLSILLLGLQANTARSIYPKADGRNLGHPLVLKVQNIPQENLFTYQSILVDKVNRLFITNNHSVFIYDGLNYQQIQLPDNPIVCSNGNDRIAIAAKGILNLLVLNSNDSYTTKELIKQPVDFNFQINSLGFDKENKLYFSTGKKLWCFEDRPKLIDSTDHNINIYPTSKGLVFFSDSKGFYSIHNGRIVCYSESKFPFSNILTVISNNECTFAITPSSPWIHSINGKSIESFNKLSNFLNQNEKIQKAFSAGPYLFVSTSYNQFLAFDSQGNLVFKMSNLSLFNYEQPSGLSTNDGVTFFAITPTQIYKFIDPRKVKLYNENENLTGTINSSIIFKNNIYVATSAGLYISGRLLASIFEQIKEGYFEDLFSYENNLFAAGTDGLFRIDGEQVTKINSDKLTFYKSLFFDKKNPKAITLSDRGVYYINLEPPFTSRECLTSNINYTNFTISNQYLILKGENSKLYYYSQEINNLLPQQLSPVIISGTTKNLYKLGNDTIYILNNRIIKHSKSGDFLLINTNLSQGNTFLTNYHPNYRTLIIEEGNTKPRAVFSIGRSYNINSVYFDEDSTAWLSTNQGLIFVSKDYQKTLTKIPQLGIYSLTSLHHKTIDTIYFESSKNHSSLLSEYKIKQGHTIQITLNSPITRSSGNFQFSYKLSSNQNKWSDWNENNKVNLIGLPPGKNIVNIRVRDIYGNVSPEFKLIFDIIPSFFRTQFTLIALVILLILIVFTIVQWRNYKHALERFTLESIINRRTEELVKEKEKTDNLLERVLPRETATELKETGKVNTQKFNMATVLFSDIQGFTKITDDLNPESLIDQLDKFFLYFDSVVDKYKIEKIKTIGDAYMCAGGIPHKNRTNPVEVVLAALEMINYMHTINREHSHLQDIWDLRIGIDTGPVIAGVVGRNKLSYDIWGTTVNTASRMESSGEVGKINISGNTYILVQDYFLCTYRGKMPIKNKGDIEMYFVDGIRPELSNNYDLFKPNADFLLQLQFLRFGDVEEFILEKLEKGLPKNLYYHNLKHTIDVYTQVELIGRSENVTQEEQLLLQTAALFHDAGHLIDYDTHEEMGVKLAREILPDYQYSERQIEIISELILVTKLPPKPKNLMEAIMCDADLDYLGRVDFIPVSNMLYKELHEHGRIGTIQEWNEMQIKFIEKHQYFTNTARSLRNVNKNSQLENIKKWIEENKL